MMPKGATLVRVLTKIGLIHEHDIVNRHLKRRGKDIIETSYTLEDEDIARIKERHARLTRRKK